MRPGWAVQTENRGIHAVPTPGRVTIDGKLNDWDLSGQVLQCYDVDTLLDVYSGRIAMMYDAENLYVSIVWKDATPMGNSHEPQYQSGKGWAGDCVQLRMKTDRICHVTAWYYAGKQEPFINIHYGKSLTEPFGGSDKNLFRTAGWKLSDGAEMAFLKDADGKGYVQEIKLPWALLTEKKRYVAGERLSCGIELLWGEADWPVHRYADNLAEGTNSREFFWTAYNAWGSVMLEPKGHLALPTPAYLKALEPESPRGPVTINYTLPVAARVTLAINDARGQRVRTLVPALPRKKGTNTERWDGLDDDGKPVTPGEYTYSALYHQGVHANWVMSFCNPGNPSWQTPDGRGAFYGDHTAPQAVASAGNYTALACPIGEAGQHLIGCDLTGQRLWGLANRVFGDGKHITLATDGVTLWVGMEGSTTLIYRVAVATGQYAPWKLTATDAEGRDYQLLELPVSTLPGSPDGKVNLTAIAVREGALAVCLARENRVEIRDADTSAIRDSYRVEDPRAVVFDTDGSLVVLAHTALIRLTRAGVATPFTAGEFPAGVGLAIDAQRNIYLSRRGEEQNVQVFSPEGKPLREIGTRGGRLRYGPYHAQGMLNPGQIAIDRQGHLWVPEETVNPKRTSIWNIADGTLFRELVGTTGYAGAGAINPDEPTMGFAEDTVFKLDLATGVSVPVYSLAAREGPNDLFPPSAQSRSRTLTYQGMTYHYTTGSARGSLEVHCTLLKDGIWRSAAHLGIVKRENAGEWAKYLHPFFAGHENQAYAWVDQNGDGLVQQEELTFAPDVRWWSNYWGQLPGPDGVITFLNGQTLVKFAITGVSPCGAPVYDIVHPRVVPMAQPLLHGGEGMVIGGTQGRVYINQDPLLAVDDAGKVLFTYPSHHVSVHGSHTAKAARSGYLIGPSALLGTADFGGQIGEVFYLNGNLGENYLFTADGLYIQTLFKDTRGSFDTPTQMVRNMSFDATTAGGESFGGNFLRAKDGKVYLLQGGTDARVLQLTGLESIRRFTGRLTYTAKQYTAAQQLLLQRAAQTNEVRSYRIARAQTPVQVDGKADDWPTLLNDEKDALEIRESAQQRYARVQACYDDANLYLAYHVFAQTNRLRNAGQDLRLLFKTGDCVDLMLSPSNGVRETGNLRLLLSQPGVQPLAVLYLKSVPGTPAVARVPFSSPWRTIFFDQVVVAPINIRVATGPAPNGYFVEVAVPWARLGIKPAPGLVLKGDVGVLFADQGGTTTISRQYWSNKATGLVNDVPGEADLSPALWGEFTLE